MSGVTAAVAVGTVPTAVLGDHQWTLGRLENGSPAAPVAATVATEVMRLVLDGCCSRVLSPARTVRCSIRWQEPARHVTKRRPRRSGVQLFVITATL